MDPNESTHGWSLSASYHWQENSLFPFFSSSEDIIWRVRGISSKIEREWRGTPPLDRPLTGNRREEKEIDTIVPEVLR